MCCDVSYRLEVDSRTELEDVVLVVEALRVVVAVIDFIIGKAESDGGRILIGYADAVALRVVKTVGIEVSLLIAEVAAPLIIPLLLSVDEEQIGGTIVPRHIVGDVGRVAGDGVKALGISYTDEGVVMLHILEAESGELEEILLDIEDGLPRGRTVFGSVTDSRKLIGIETIQQTLVKILPVVDTLEGDGGREVVAKVGAVSCHITLCTQLICTISIFIYPHTVNSDKEVFAGLPSKVEGIVHIVRIGSIICIEETGVRVAADNRSGIEVAPVLRELETIYTIVTVDSLIVDIETVVGFKVEEETSDAELDVPRKHRVDINVTD